MVFQSTKMQGVYLIKPDNFRDNRGSFIKILNQAEYSKLKLDGRIEESFYTISKKNVIRGMHFQKPPKDHAKIVTVVRGKITDVILDIRKKSPTFGQFLTVELSSKNCRGVYIPSGLAHGFVSRENQTMVFYLLTKGYSPVHDVGIKWNSFGYNWKVKRPIISKRDQEHPRFDNFVTPFK